MAEREGVEFDELPDEDEGSYKWKNKCGNDHEWLKENEVCPVCYGS